MLGKLALCLCLLLLCTCKDPYNIKVASAGQQLLVVEGNIDNSGAGTTFILSRTAPVKDSTKTNPPVADAVVTVEAKDGTSYPLPPTAAGIYHANVQQLQTGAFYRLHIRTQEGREYRSEYVQLIENPRIDSLSWQRTAAGVTIYVNTHDPRNRTHYYRWSFDEVYEFHGMLSWYMFISPQVVVKRGSPELVYYCWKYDTAATIFTGSSAKLGSDVIYQYPLVFYAANTEPLAIKYRIHVNQYALSKDAYDFYTAMKKNTESLGTIFDPLPSQLPTNIHCISDPNENVIGFVTASPVQEEILFIRKDDLPGWNYSHACLSQHVGNAPDSLQAAYYANLVPTDLDHSNNNSGYLMSAKECVECTYRGTNVKPPFW